MVWEEKENFHGFCDFRGFHGIDLTVSLVLSYESFSYICSSVPRCQIRKMSFDLVGKTLEIVLNSKFNWEIGPQTFICLLYLPFFWINLITGCLCDTFSFLLFLLNYLNLQIIFLDLKFFKFIYFIFAHCFWLKGGSDTLFSFLLLFSIVFWNNVS